MKLQPIKSNRGVLALPLCFCFVIACSSGNTTGSVNGNASNPNSAGSLINEIYLAKDDAGKPGDKAEVFGPDVRTIHCAVELKVPAPGTKVKFSWWIVSAAGAENEKINDFEYVVKENEEVVHSNLTIPNTWPQGKYKVEFYVNNTLEKTVNFTVE